MTITAEEIAELRRLEQEATPGLWSHRNWGDGDIEVSSDDQKYWEPVLFRATGRGTESDARLIAAMRNAMPRLLDEVERLPEGVFPGERKRMLELTKLLREENIRLREALEVVAKETGHRHHLAPHPVWCELCHRSEVARSALVGKNPVRKFGYGVCPSCNQESRRTSRERRPNGYTHCGACKANIKSSKWDEHQRALEGGE